MVASRPELVKDRIDVNGADYSGQQQTVMRINIDFTDNTMYLTDRNGYEIHAGLGKIKYFSFTLYNKNKQKKKELVMRADDCARMVPYNDFSLTRFEIGDYVEIFHEEPPRLIVEGERATQKTTLYKITQNGLVPEYKVDGTTFHFGGSGTGAFDLELMNNTLYVKNKTRGFFEN